MFLPSSINQVKMNNMKKINSFMSMITIRDIKLNTYKILITGIIFMFLSVQLNAQSFVLDVQYNPMSFTNNARTVIYDPGHNGGLKEGSIHRYDNVITLHGITVYAKLTILDVKDAEIRNFDDDIITGDSKRFQPRIGSTKNNKDGQVLYQLEFFNEADGSPVFLYNYWLTGVDIDGGNDDNHGETYREYVEIGGYTSYQVDATTKLTVTTDPNDGTTRFKGRAGSLDGITFENTACFIANYSNPNNKIIFALGITNDKVTERYFSVQFGAPDPDGPFDNPVIVQNPLPVAIDDIGTIVNSITGGTSINNVLDNDLFDGEAVIPSQVNISLVTPASNSGVVLNTSTGAVTVAPGTPVGTYTLTYKICLVDDASACDLANVTVQVVLLNADLSISKSASKDPVKPGETFIYTLTVENNGPNTASNVTVQDILPSSLNLLNVNPSSGTWSAPSWNIGSVENGTSKTLAITVSVKSGTSGSITNTATVRSSTNDPNTNNNSAVKTIQIVQLSADIEISKTASKNPVQPGEIFTYTINVKNNGPDAATGVSVQDVLPSSLNFIGADASVGTWSAPSWTIGSIANGTTKTLTMTVSAKSNASGDIVNTATVTSNTADPNPNNNSATKTISVEDTEDIINHFPASGYGTLAFEDLWPGKGDYDFNDLVLDYQFEIITNHNNKVDQLKGTFIIKAFGAALQNGFGFQLSDNILANDIQVSGYSLTENFINLSSNGTEAGQSKPTIIVYDNAFNQMPHPGIGIGVNTESSAPYITPDTIQIIINFPGNKYSYNDLDISHFNPFLIVNLERGVEVHLPDYPPTDLVDQSKFQTFDDNTNPSQGIYYKTENNLPWAINIYESFSYPSEKKDITWSYLKFAEWATSGGINYPNWYQDIVGYRNSSNIYQLPF